MQPGTRLNPRHIRAVARVDTDDIAHIHKQRHGHLQAGFRIHLLGSAGRRVAGDRHLGVSDFMLHIRRQLVVDDFVLVRQQFELHVFRQIQEIIAEQVLKEINARLGFLLDVGLDYLTLSRNAGTLAGGEAQRIRLASQIGSGLVGVLYVLDEPSIGLHQRDNHRLIETLIHLRDLGNTVLVVEHDEDTIKVADYVVDIGPGAGEHGGAFGVRREQEGGAAGSPRRADPPPVRVAGRFQTAPGLFSHDRLDAGSRLLAS